jgi:arsenite transporter
MLDTLAFVARHGRYVLLVGLIAGLLLQDLAQLLKPWLPQMVALLLFLTAFRIGHRQAIGGLTDFANTAKVVLSYQLVLPLLALAVFNLFGVAGSIYAIGVVLLFSAAPLAGSPNLAIMLGGRPEPALRVLILGTAILPLTVIPVFWLSPELGNLGVLLAASLRLLVVIWLVILVAFMLRALARPDFTPASTEALDGAMAITLAVMAVGLMAALGPAIISDPVEVLKWMILVFVSNLGLQFVAFKVIRFIGWKDVAVPFAVVSGNRNIALFLVALPMTESESFLIFLGCYQFPVLLTAILMRPVFCPKSTR